MRNQILFLEIPDIRPDTHNRSYKSHRKSEDERQRQSDVKDNNEFVGTSETERQNDFRANTRERKKRRERIKETDQEEEDGLQKRGKIEEEEEEMEEEEEEEEE